MTTVFSTQAFSFEKGETIPDHTEGWPNWSDEPMDPTKFHIEGFIPEDGDANWLAINIKDRETAEFLLRAARRGIEQSKDRTQLTGFDIEDLFRLTVPSI